MVNGRKDCITGATIRRLVLCRTGMPRTPDIGKMHMVGAIQYGTMCGKRSCGLSINWKEVHLATSSCRRAPQQASFNAHKTGLPAEKSSRARAACSVSCLPFTASSENMAGEETSPRETSWLMLRFTNSTKCLRVDKHGPKIGARPLISSAWLVTRQVRPLPSDLA